MLNREKHQLIMGEILKDVYSDISLASLLGFKGGTCAYFFYGLPRFSVDLDFDLFPEDKTVQKFVFEKTIRILEKYGKIKDSYIKKFTIFILLSYGDSDHNIKIEINTRHWIKIMQDYYELKKYLGISMMVSKKDYLFASKLVALTERTEMAARDLYDIYYFLKNHWDINEEVIKIRTGKSIKEYLTDCAAFVEKIKHSRILHGIGELLGNKEKAWVKSHLKAELIFMLKNYMAAMK